MKIVKSILIVGGGTAGLITAMILKKKLDIQVDVVYSKNVGIVGVGEGSTEHFREFMEFVGINQFEIIKETDATYKAGIMFEGWGSKDYFHSVAGPFNKKYGQYSYVYGKQISENLRLLHPRNFWNNKISNYYINKINEPVVNQYHFNTYKLNDFLQKKSLELGINLYEDTIEDVFLDEQGYVKSLQGEKHIFQYDFYIDATGFKKTIMNKLGGKWDSFSKYLKMNSAITFPTPDEENYNMWTLAKAMKSGWRFKIPVWGRHGNGYIFDNNFCTAESAKQEIEKEIGISVDVGKQFTFDPGKLEKVWIKNCCAVGLSGSFVEPLEASSIGTSIQQAFLLMHQLPCYDQRIIDRYNKSFDDIMFNIRDFIFLHYINCRDDTEFWKSIKQTEIPDSLASKLELWRKKLPMNEDFNDVSDYILFRGDNFTLVMDGLELFDRQFIREEYVHLNSVVKHDAELTISNYLNQEKNDLIIDHKKFISIIRNYF
jgi:tryptophan halogenase